MLGKQRKIKITLLNALMFLVTSNRPSLRESNLNITTTLIVGGGIAAFLVFIIVVLIMLCTKCRNGGQEDKLFRCRKGI